MKIHKISAITLIVENMERSCRFYSQIPGFKLVYGGFPNDTFTTFEIEGEEKRNILKICLNLEMAKINNNHESYHITENDRKRQQFGRIIFHTENVDELYSYFKKNKTISNLISFENEPTNATWGERYFHIREPDGYQLSFAEPIVNKRFTNRHTHENG